MNYQRNLTFAQLIKLMQQVTANYARLTQRDTISDIADLAECLDMAIENSTYLERFWAIRDSGTVMCRTADFGDWDHFIVERYRIMWSENSKWTFEEL